MLQIQLSITIASNPKSAQPAATSDDGELSQCEASFDSDNFDNSPTCYFETVAAISSIVYNMDRPPRYKAATDPNNNTQIAADGNGSWFCEKNNISNYLPRYVLCCCIQGSDGQMCITAYMILHKQY